MLKGLRLSYGLAYEWRRVKRQGLYKIPFKAAKYIVSFFLWLLLLPLTLVLHLAGYRRVTVFTDRVGHLAIEPDCLVKEQVLGLIPERRWFILAPSGRVANSHLLNYWKPLIRVYENRLACFILSSMSLFGLMRYDISHYILAKGKIQAAYTINKQWEGRKPVLSLTREDEEWGAKAFRKMGLPENFWFVCVHVREPGFSPVDEELHNHRNGSVKNVMPAINEIIRRGGWVFRIGDASMTRLSATPYMIDYAHHSMKSEKLDVILCAKAKFILGNTSGISIVGSVFGVPCAITNMIPMTDLWFSKKDLCIPKLLWSRRLGRYLQFEEILNSPVAGYRNASLYKENGIKVEENSSDDILELVKEMFDNLEGRREEKIRENKYSRAMDSLILQHGYNFTAKIASRFLIRHKKLLLQPEKKIS